MVYVPSLVRLLGRTGAHEDRWSSEDGLAALHTYHCRSCHVPRRHLGRLELDRHRGRSPVLSHSHVCHHRLVSPLLFSSDIQDYADVPVCLCGARQFLRATRPALVRPSSSPSYLVRHTGRCAFASTGRISVVAYRLVYVADSFRASAESDFRL